MLTCAVRFSYLKSKVPLIFFVAGGFSPRRDGRYWIMTSKMEAQADMAPSAEEAHQRFLSETNYYQFITWIYVQARSYLPYLINSDAN